MDIDPGFDFRRDTPEGRDIDRFSPTLKRYHQLLWSKETPSGRALELLPGRGGNYLEDRSSDPVLYLSSDAITNSYATTRIPTELAVPRAQLEDLYSAGCTIGAYILFPSNQVNRRTINGARGMSSRIADRFDLTLECIRRHYRGDESPLSEVLGNYQEFFALFVDFDGYLDFFLLRDLVDDEGRIRWFLPFDGFGSSAYPRTLAEYAEYAARSIEFVHARNRRMAEYAATH